mmetsp:Transcript_27444/g.69206  ORF Transcript_27444/g.69206 Transcript_27444/m.69206 type:complete len:593 (-) Transcript_27444:1099-2877(-)
MSSTAAVAGAGEVLAFKISLAEAAFAGGKSAVPRRHEATLLTASPTPPTLVDEALALLLLADPDRARVPAPAPLRVLLPSAPAGPSPLLPFAPSSRKGSRKTGSCSSFCNNAPSSLTFDTLAKSRLCCSLFALFEGVEANPALDIPAGDRASLSRLALGSSDLNLLLCGARRLPLALLKEALPTDATLRIELSASSFFTLDFIACWSAAPFLAPVAGLDPCFSGFLSSGFAPKNGSAERPKFQNPAFLAGFCARLVPSPSTVDEDAEVEVMCPPASPPTRNGRRPPEDEELLEEVGPDHWDRSRPPLPPSITLSCVPPCLARWSSDVVALSVVASSVGTVPGAAFSEVDGTTSFALWSRKRQSSASQSSLTPSVATLAVCCEHLDDALIMFLSGLLVASAAGTMLCMRASKRAAKSLRTRSATSDEIASLPEKLVVGVVAFAAPAPRGGSDPFFGEVKVGVVPPFWAAFSGAVASGVLGTGAVMFPGTILNCSTTGEAICITSSGSSGRIAADAVSAGRAMRSATSGFTGGRLKLVNMSLDTIGSLGVRRDGVPTPVSAFTFSPPAALVSEADTFSELVAAFAPALGVCTVP